MTSCLIKVISNQANCSLVVSLSNCCDEIIASFYCAPFVQTMRNNEHWNILGTKDETTVSKKISGIMNRSVWVSHWLCYQHNMPGSDYSIYYYYYCLSIVFCLKCALRTVCYVYASEASTFDIGLHRAQVRWLTINGCRLVKNKFVHKKNNSVLDIRWGGFRN